jgi:hypothetical protein
MNKLTLIKTVSRFFFSGKHLGFPTWCFSITLALASWAHASEPKATHPDLLKNPAYYELQAPTIRQLHFVPSALEDSGEKQLPEDPFQTIHKGMDSAGILFDKLVNFGKQFWALLEGNRPIVSFSHPSASALPSGITSWDQMADWKAPRSELFEVEYTNGIGMHVVRFHYRLNYTYGGTVQGKGAYLTQIQVLPEDLKVLSGFTLNAQVEVPSITNAGTSEHPIAAAQVVVQWSIDTILSHVEASQMHYVRGDGELQTFGLKKDEAEEESASPSDSPLAETGAPAGSGSDAGFTEEYPATFLDLNSRTE